MGPEGSFGLPGAPGPKASVHVNLLVTLINDCFIDDKMPGFWANYLVYWILVSSCMIFPILPYMIVQSQESLIQFSKWCLSSLRSGTIAEMVMRLCFSFAVLENVLQCWEPDNSQYTSELSAHVIFIYILVVLNNITCCFFHPRSQTYFRKLYWLHCHYKKN